MKTRQRLVAILTAAFILSGSFPVSATEADRLSGEPATEQESSAGAGETVMDDGTSPEEQTAEQENSTGLDETAMDNETFPEEQESSTGADETIKNDEASPEDQAAEQENSAGLDDGIADDESLSGKPGTEWENTERSEEETADNAPLSEMPTISGNETEDAGEDKAEDDYPLPAEAPSFHAHIEHPYMGYTVRGTFTDFTPDIIRIDTLYSLDGESWQTVIGGDWNLSSLGTDDSEELSAMQNQYCVYNAYEPMKSYTTGETDRFYLKLHITKKNGLSYETQSAVIEREHGVFQPIPEGTKYAAMFSSAISVREPDPASPFRFRMYGRYQLTVSQDATAEGISALLPDTLPVEVQLAHGRDFRVNGVVDCPVTWKQLSLPRLSAGECVTLPDVAEEIIVPEGTVLTTPIGTFQLGEPITLDSPPLTDEVRLILNVSAEDRNLSGVLKEDRDGLKIALRQRPTGAAAIQAYVLTEGESKWMELPGLSLLKELNTHPSTESSGFALVLRSDQEPYQSYLAAREAGTSPTPFFVGLKIQGGIYDGRQLILAWPDIYDELPDLPEVGLTEGNEGNAGAGNRDDSTEGGQRPNLPQTPEDSPQAQPTPSAPAPEDSQQANPTPTAPAAGDSQQAQPTPTAPAAGDSQQAKPTPTAPAAGSNQQAQPTPTAPIPDDRQQAVQPSPIADGDRQEQQKSPASDDSGQMQQAPAAPTPETASAISGNRNTLSPDSAVPAQPSDQPGNQPISGQRPYLYQMASDLSGTSPVNGEDSQVFAPLVVQAAEDTKDAETILASSPAGTAVEDTAGNDRRIPFLPLATVAAAGGCVSAAVCKAAGYRPFHRIAAKIRELLRK